MPPTAFIFDMDGVIVDSMPFHKRAWEIYLARIGMDASLANGHMHGRHNDELLRDLLGSEAELATIRTMGSEKERIYRDLILPHLSASLLPGLDLFLRRYPAQLKAIASNAEGPNVDFVLEAAGLGHYFSVVLNGGHVARGKPDPEIYLKAAEGLRIAPENCIVFEDSQPGINAGRGAGMTVVGINSHRTALHGVALEADSFLDSRLLQWVDERIST